MAAIGETPLILFHSTTATNAPVPGAGGNLAVGELALNIPDGKLYFTDGVSLYHFSTGGGGGSGTVTSVDGSGGTTGLTLTGGPITTSGTLTLGGTLNVLNGGTGSTTASGARTNLGAAASGANSDITSLSGITGAISSPTYIQYGNGSGTTLADGRMWYDQTNGSLNFGMGGGNITQQVGEELFVYGKASAAISGNTLLQAIYKTGTVGASGVIQFAPTISGITDPGAIIGVATEDIANNGFGRITNFGVVHGVDTTGSTYGETWANNDDIWYNPVTGGLTHTKPSAPNMKFQIGTVINAGSGGSGSFQVFLQAGSTLGGSDSNVGFGSLNNGDLIQYSTGLGYWTNVAPTSITIGTASNLAGGGAGTIPYQSAAGTTAMLAAGTSGQVLQSNGAAAPSWVTPAAGTVTTVSVATANGFAGTVANATTTPAITLTTSVTGILQGNGTAISAASTTGSGNVVLDTSPTLITPVLGTPTSGTLTNCSGLPVSSGISGLGTGVATALAVNTGSAGAFVVNGGALGTPASGTLTNCSGLSLTTGVTGTLPIANGGTGQTTASAAFNALSPVTSTGDLIIGNGANSSTRLAIGTNNYVLTSNGTTATWAAVQASTTTNALTFNTTGGVAPTSTFNGSSAVTIDYHSVGAAPVASPTFTGTVTLPTGTNAAEPLLWVAGTNLTTPVQGAQEFDGNSLYVTGDTTNGSGRQIIESAQVARLAASASVPSGNQFFTATVRPALLSGHLYKFTYNLIFTKNTTGTVTFAFTNSGGSNYTALSADATISQQGYGTTSVSNIFANGATTTSQASLPLTDTFNYVATIEGYVIPSANTRLQLTVTDSAGTITSQLGSNFVVTDLGAATTIGNIG